MNPRKVPAHQQHTVPEPDAHSDTPKRTVEPQAAWLELPRERLSLWRLSLGFLALQGFIELWLAFPLSLHGAGAARLLGIPVALADGLAALLLIGSLVPLTGLWPAALAGRCRPPG